MFLCRVYSRGSVCSRPQVYVSIVADQDQVLIVPMMKLELQHLEAIGKPTAPYDKNDVVMIS